MKYRHVFVFFSVLALAVSCSSSPAPQSPNMLADIDPIEMGTLSLEFDKFFSSDIEMKEIKIFFDPRINSVYLDFKYQMVYYRQYWDKPARDAFIAALNRYYADYDAKALLVKESKTRKIYGKTTGMTRWSTLNSSFSAKSNAYPVMEIGYTFKKDKPYFSILQLEAKEVLENNKNSNEPLKTSLRIRTYYTRDQAGGLAKYFDNDYLMGLIRDYAKPSTGGFSPDDYGEETKSAAPLDDYNN
jgi:hypothetical protein